MAAFLRAAIAVILVADAYLLVGDRARVVPVRDAIEDFSHGEFSTTPPLPAAGVYAYDTTGSARVDRLSIRRRFPATTTRTVRTGGSCGYQETVTIFREHVETYDVCKDGNDAREAGFGTAMTFYRVRTSASLDCGNGVTRAGGGMAPGESRTYECSGDGVRATVTATYEGTGTAVVDGTEVPCRRVVLATLLTGSYDGSTRRALCTDEATGLVLAEERSARVVLRTLVGRGTYTERATFRLRSLVPETA